jgi:hypothetical protein
VAAIAVFDMVDVTSRIADVEDTGVAIQASIGIGLWIVLLGAGASIAGCVLALASQRRWRAARTNGSTTSARLGAIESTPIAA